MSLIYRLYEWMHDRLSRPDERGEHSAGKWQDAVRQQVLGFLAGRAGRMLEIGCGEGLFLAQLAKAAPEAELYGIDNDEGRIKLAEKRLAPFIDAMRLRLKFAEAPLVPFEDGYFDATVCVNVTLSLPSVDTLKSIVAEMGRITKKGGSVIIEYRNADNPLLIMKYKLAPYYDETVKNYPFTMFKPDYVEWVLAQAGLSVKRRSYLPSFFNRTKWLKRIAPIIVIEAEKR